MAIRIHLPIRVHNVLISERTEQKISIGFTKVSGTLIIFEFMLMNHITIHVRVHGTAHKL